MSKVVSIHQPETFPYPGFFNKMMMCDEFIILDNVQFKKNNYQNRNRILHQGNPKWLTLPVVLEGRLTSTIMDTKIADTVDWKSRSLKYLEDAYRDSRYFNDHMPHLESIIRSANDILIDFNMQIIEYIRGCLGITSRITFSSDIPVNSHKSDLVFDLCDYVGASKYLSGAGGRGYLEETRFQDADILVGYQKYTGASYSQLGGNSFVPYLSTIDLLMNLDNEMSKLYVSTAFKYEF